MQSKCSQNKDIIEASEIRLHNQIYSTDSKFKITGSKYQNLAGFSCFDSARVLGKINPPIIYSLDACVLIIWRPRESLLTDGS